jgi:hypothetical protein
VSGTFINSSGVTFPDSTVQATAATGFGFKNRIINGAMMIDQRNNGASVTLTNTSSGTYLVDRWAALPSVASKFSVQQNAGSVTPPTGFTKYLGATSLSAYSISSSDYFFIYQSIEGYNFSDLGWGTLNAQTVTLSFKVYSSLTGTFGGSIRNGTGTRSYPFSYSIPVANTWTSISITIAGDTSGTWATDNTAGAILSFSLGSGSAVSGTSGAWVTGNILSATGAVSVVGTSGATFYITGVQLEKGTTATSFDYRPYGTELALCQRYYQKSYAQGVTPGTPYTSGSGSVYWGSASSGSQANYCSFVSSMRAVPTFTVYDGAGTANKMCYYSGGWSNGGSVTYISNASDTRAPIQAGTSGAYFSLEFTASSEL